MCGLKKKLRTHSKYVHGARNGLPTPVKGIGGPCDRKLPRA